LGYEQVTPRVPLALAILALSADVRADDRKPLVAEVRRSPAGAPITSADAWETELAACVPVFKLKPKCLTELFLRVPPRQLPLFEEEAERLSTEVSRWLGKDELVAHYRVKEAVLGEWMTIRHYVLEDSRGNVRLMRVGFRRVLGEWWVHGARLFDKTELEKELGLD
jgi:hypothetical protein